MNLAEYHLHRENDPEFKRFEALNEDLLRENVELREQLRYLTDCLNHYKDMAYKYQNLYYDIQRIC